MTVKSKKGKTTIKYPRERKKLCEQKIAKNNSKLLLFGKFDFDPKENSDKSLLFDLKKTSEEKIFDLILEKILDKNHLYIEHREGANAFRIRKDSKQAKEDELKTVLETVDKVTSSYNFTSSYDEDKKADSDSKIDGDGCVIFGENKKFDKLIVMDNVSGLADNLNDFANYLTVSQNFRYVCLYIFHIIYPTKSIREMILPQTKTFNIFPSTT